MFKSYPSSAPLRVAPGTETLLTLSAGTVLHVDSGRLTLRPPLRWLAERCTAREVELRTGAVWVVPESGVWGLQARGEGALLRNL